MEETIIPCVQKGSQAFTYLELGDPGVPEGTKRGLGIRRFNEERLLEAADSCYDCPKMLKCGETASEVDLYWTVRGGELPTALQGGRKEDVVPTADTSDYFPKLCKHGHNDWRPRKNVKGVYCHTCMKARAGEKRAEGRANEGLEGEVHWTDE